MQIRRSLAMGLGLALFVPLALPGAVGAETPETVSVVKADLWLRTQQQADGGFEVAGFPGFETPDAVLAIASVGSGAWDQAGARAYVEAAQIGGKGPLDNIDDLVDGDADPTTVAAGARAAKITALVVQPLGMDPADFDPSGDSAPAVDLLDRIDEHRNVDGSYDFGAQFNGLLYTAIALGGEGGPVPAALVAQIRAAQRTDGSWDYTGTTTGGGDDIDTTAIALMALRSAGVTSSDADAAQGVAFLASRQQASGAWQAFGSDDPNSTSLASIALSDLRIDVTSAGWRSAAGSPASGTYVSPLAWLRSQQDDDGHIASPNDGFGVNTFATSQSMQALGDQWFLWSERRDLVDAWSRELASPAAAESTGNGGDDAGALASNASVRSARLAAATAIVNGQDGREAAATDLFAAAFGRSIDPSGRTYWSNQLKTLARPEVLARLTGSSEFYRKAGSTIPTFVDRVYLAVLGRTADAGGRAYWIAQLEGGRSVLSVARSLTGSSEYRRTQVRVTYQRVLDRQPTAGERDHWTTKVATTRIEVLAATLAASAERYGALAG